MKIKGLMLGSMISAGLKIASAGLSFLMFMFLARVLDTAEYGLFGSMFALGTVGGIAALFGQHTLSIKMLSALGDGAQAAADRRQVLRLNYGITLVGAAVFVAALLAGGALAGTVGVDIDMRYLLGASVLVLPFALSELVSHQYRAFGAVFGALAPRDVVWRGAVVLACLGAAGIPIVFAGALNTMVAVAAALMLIVGGQMLVMVLRYRHRFARATGRQSGVTLPWRAAAWMWLASLGTMGAGLNLSITALMVPLDQVGAYFAAQKIAQLLQLPVMAVNIVASPLFARLHSQNDLARLRAVGRKLALLITGPLLLGTLIIAFFAPRLLALFDPTFTVAAVSLAVLAGSHLFIGMGGPSRQLMLMSDGERDVVWLTLITQAAGLLLVPVLVPFYGILGAAVAACVSRVLFTVMTVLWCRARLGVDTSVLSLLPGLGPRRK